MCAVCGVVCRMWCVLCGMCMVHMWYMVCVVYVVWCVIGMYVACVLCVWCVVWCVVYMAWYVCAVICDLCMFGVFVYMMGGCGAVCDTGVEAMRVCRGRSRSRGGGLVARASSETEEVLRPPLHPTCLPLRAHQGRLLLFTVPLASSREQSNKKERSISPS